MTATVWWIVALVLGGLELLTGTFYLLMLSLSALMVALALEFFWMDGIAQGVVFSLLAVGLCGLLASRRPASLKAASTPINRGSKRWIDRELILPDGIVDGQARARLDDSHWQIKGPDCEPGSRVVVVAVEGNVLIVAVRQSDAG